MKTESKVKIILGLAAVLLISFFSIGYCIPYGDIFKGLSKAIDILNKFAGPAMVIIGIFGLRQLVLMKKDYKFRVDRSAKEKAVEMSYRFIEYTDIDYAYIGELKGKGFKTYKGKIGNFSIKSLPKERLVELKNILHARGYLEPLTKLDIIAGTFIAGVADEELGFDLIGYYYCSRVKVYYDILCVTNQAKPWITNNIIELYNTWSARIKKVKIESKLEDMSKEFEKQYDAVMKEIDEIEVKGFPPIGKE